MYDVNNFMENFLLYFLNMLLKGKFSICKVDFYRILLYTVYRKVDYHQGGYISAGYRY